MIRYRRHALFEASAKQLRALQERRLEEFDLVALILDGKTFAAE